MAAVSCGCKCYCMKLHLFRNLKVSRSSEFLRSFSSQANTEQLQPPRRKKRDRLTVLKALSSTVEDVPNKPDYRFFDDIILNPRSQIKQKELLLALESGTKAAEYVLDKHPELFPLRNPVPEWPKERNLKDLIEDSIENLEILMTTEDNKTKVIDIYEKLRSEGDLSLDVHNKVLEFVGFHAIASGKVTQPAEDSTTESTSSSSSLSSDSPEEETKDKQLYDVESTSTWRSDGYAEHLFSEFKDKANAKTYEAFILGLLKHNELIRAFHLFKEFEDNSFTGSLYFYNTLLTRVCDVRTGDTDRWDLAKEIVASMTRCGVLPDVVTYNNLLGIAVEMEQDSQQLCQSLLREMKKLKIVPSLGSYYYILQSERKKDRQDLRVLIEIVSDLKKGVPEYVLRHPTDIMLFHSAMDLARFKRHGSLAQELLSVVLDNGLQHFLGGKHSAFFGNYLCAISRNAQSMDDVVKEYERIVPKYLIPRDWVYQQLLFACRNHKNPKMVPKLYTDMVSMRVPLTERVAYALYAAMEDNIPKEDAGEFLRVVQDSTKWMEIFRVRMTAEIISTSIKVLCLNDLYEEASLLMDNAKKMELLPSADAMLAVLKLNLKESDKEAALNTIKYTAENKIKIGENFMLVIEESELLAEKREKVLDLLKK